MGTRVVIRGPTRRASGSHRSAPHAEVQPRWVAEEAERGIVEAAALGSTNERRCRRGDGGVADDAKKRKKEKRARILWNQQSVTL